MQNRYTGDIGDFGKLGLLRQLSSAGFRIGVNWYLVPDEDHNNDGRHISYLKKDSFCSCDGFLWRQLGKIVDSGIRRVSALEESDILPATYYSRPLDFSGVEKSSRDALRWEWHCLAVEKLRGCDVIFVDPDNGLIVPSAVGTPKSNKFVLPQELVEYYRSGASVVYYQHKARRPDDFYLAQHEELLASGAFPNSTGAGVKFISISQRYYFFIIQPRHKAQIEGTLSNMLKTNWARYFKSCYTLAG
jgi:hypothetical protein